MEGQGKGQRGNYDNHQHQHLLLLSEDVLIQILLCLPVKSLLQFKSVCKLWHSIIESTFFINLHATTTTEDSGIFLGYYSDKKNKVKFFKVSGDGQFEDLGRPPLLDLAYLREQVVVGWYFKEWEKCSVAGCCNGIICFHDNYTRNIILWNPAIKQSRLVPKPSNLLGNRYCFDDDDDDDDDNDDDDDDGYGVEDVVAFGVDVKTKDYKVILMTTLQLPHATYENMNSTVKQRVHVYSLSTDSWRCINAATLSTAHLKVLNLQLYKYVLDPGVYLNGKKLFNLINQQHFCTMPLILWFDFTEEIFRTIQPPYDDRKNKKNVFPDPYFISFDEKIAFVSTKQIGGFDIWVLNEQNGVKESWTKIYTIEKKNYTIEPLSANRPLCIMNNGEVAICRGLGLYDGGKLRLLNLITGETKDIQSDCRLVDLNVSIYEPINVSIYKPSLVQIDRQITEVMRQQMRKACEGEL